MIKIVLSLLVVIVFVANAKESSQKGKVGKVISTVYCNIEPKENRITCQYNFERIKTNREITFQWIDPKGVLKREKTFNIPKYHSFIYDYRYITGRETGSWKVNVIENGIKTSSNFYLEKYN